MPDEGGLEAGELQEGAGEEKQAGEDENLSNRRKKEKLKVIIASRKEGFLNIAQNSSFRHTATPMNDTEHLVNIIAAARQLTEKGRHQEGFHREVYTAIDKWKLRGFPKEEIYGVLDSALEVLRLAKERELQAQKGEKKQETLAKFGFASSPLPGSVRNRPTSAALTKVHQQEVEQQTS